MQVNGINTNYNSRPAFQARIPQELQNNILRQAVEFGTEGLNNAKKQIVNIMNKNFLNISIFHPKSNKFVIFKIPNFLMKHNLFLIFCVTKLFYFFYHI